MRAPKIKPGAPLYLAPQRGTVSPASASRVCRCVDMLTARDRGHCPTTSRLATEFCLFSLKMHVTLLLPELSLRAPGRRQHFLVTRFPFPGASLTAGGPQCLPGTAFSTAGGVSLLPLLTDQGWFRLGHEHLFLIPFITGNDTGKMGLITCPDG